MGSGKKGTDPTRAERKAKKRKLEDAIPNVPGDNENSGESEVATKSEEPPKKRKRDQVDDNAEEDGLKKEKRSKKEKKEKKDKKKKGNDEGESAPPAETKEEVSPEKKSGAEPDKTVEGDEIPKKSKKERKAERKARDAAETVANKDVEGAAPATTSSTGPESKGAPVDADAKEKKPKKDKQKKEKKAKQDSTNGKGEKTEGKAARFIVFIGSLPYTATTASIQKHFASVKPTSVRSPMQKEDATKSKGYAFLEFDGYDHMKTCLKLFHHSMFDDGISPPRKISVELTAGGGGNTRDRKDKIKAKNDKLNEERQRRMHEEAKARAEKRDGPIDESNIHPSRRTRVPEA